MKAESFTGLVQVNQTTAEICGSKICGDFQYITVISDLLLGSCQFSSLVFQDCCLKFSEQKQKLSYFEPFQSRPKGI